MLPLSPLRFSTIGKSILRTFEILKIFRFFDNSSRTRAKAGAKARDKSKARATAMARATARARRTRARAKGRARARDGRTHGRTVGRSYLFSEMRNPTRGWVEIQEESRGRTNRVNRFLHRVVWCRFLSLLGGGYFFV